MLAEDPVTRGLGKLSFIPAFLDPIYPTRGPDPSSRVLPDWSSSLAYIGFSDWIVTSTFTQVISTDPSRPYVIGTRIVFSNTHHNDTKVTLIETLDTKPGDWLFNATGYAYWNLQEQWDPILTECSVDGDEGVNAERLRRDSRAAIKAPGDAYFDRFSNVNVSVPFNMPCARLEGSAVYTDPQLLYKQTCDLGLPSHVQLTNRRYVVDETMGAVAIFVG